MASIEEGSANELIRICIVYPVILYYSDLVIKYNDSTIIYTIAKSPVGINLELYGNS